MMKPIFAWSGTGPVPPYVSLNQRDDLAVILTVRAAGTHGAEGPLVQVQLPLEVLRKFSDQTHEFLNP